MSLLGVHKQEAKGPTVLPNLATPPATTGFFSNIGAGFEQAKAGPHSTQNAKAIYESRYYDQIVQALNAEGEHATDMVQSPVRADSPFYHPVEGEQRLPDGRVLIPVSRPFTNPFSEGPSTTRDVNPLTNLYMGGDANETNQIWSAVNRVRARKPGFLSGFKDPQSIDTLANQQRQTDLAQAGEVTTRATTLGKIGSFVGGMAGSIASLDPENFVGAFTSPVEEAAGKSVARQIVRHAAEGAAINTGAGLAAVPGQEADAEAQGQAPATAGDIAERVGENAAAGAIFGTVHAALPHTAAAAGNVVSSVVGKVAENLPLPAAVRDPIVAASIRAGTVKDRDLLHEFQRQQNPYSAVDTSTPTERAAAHVMVNEIETKEQSPLQPEAEGEHGNRLDAVAEALGVDLTPPETPTTAPVQTATVRDRSTQSPSSKAVRDYVDGYMRGEGRGNSSADLEMQQFAVNHASEIEREFQFRAQQAAQPPPPARRPASFVDGINAAEGSTRNPRSTADGYGNFTDSTWLAVAPKVTDTAGLSREQILQLRHDKTIAAAATNYYAAQNSRYLRIRGLEDSPGNLSLAHFLGPEGAAKLLKADPSTPVESLLPPDVIHANHEVLQGRSADQVIAWAHKRIGAAVDHPPARPDAVPDEGFDYTSPVPYTSETLSPDELQTNAALMQYKSGGDANGLTDALKGVEQWNPLLSQQILAWEPNEGGRIVVDGHQRVGLAKRLSANGEDIQLPTLVVREADGITAEQARVLGALRNIANGTGTLLDNAKVLRDAPEGAAMLPNNGALARDSVGLARLSYPAFGAVLNDVVDPALAAQIGLHAAHAPESHMSLIGLLKGGRIANPREAGAVVRQAMADGFGTAHEQQLSMLGDQPQQSLYAPAAKIMSSAAKRLREEKRTFKVLSDKAAKIEAAGNVLDRTANESKVIGNDEALAILERTAHSAGPVRDALIRAARAELSGTRRADAVGQFLDELGSIDLRAAAAGVAENGGAGEPPIGAGHDVALEAPDRDIPSGSEPSLFDQAVTVRDNADKFSDPHGAEAKQQTALLEHDLRPEPVESPESAPGRKGQSDTGKGGKPPQNASGESAAPVKDDIHLFDLPSTGFRVSEEGEKPQSLQEILDAADADEAAAKALRDCL